MTNLTNTSTVMVESGFYGYDGTFIFYRYWLTKALSELKKNPDDIKIIGIFFKLR